jgi:arsenate reductase
MLTIYHNPRCSKSREALALVDGSGQEVVIKEYLKTPPSKKELVQILTKLGKRPQEIIRKGESIFKEKYRGKDFSDKEWIQIMVDNPILIERPIVIKGKNAVLGRPPSKIASLLILKS